MRLKDECMAEETKQLDKYTPFERLIAAEHTINTDKLFNLVQAIFT